MAKEHVSYTGNGSATIRLCPLSPEMRAYAKEVRELYRLAGALPQMLTAQQSPVTTRDRPVTNRDHTRSALVTTIDQPQTTSDHEYTTVGHDADGQQSPGSARVVELFPSRSPVAKKH